MTASVRILSTSSIDSSPAILFIAPDGSKILVNCGEGCQREFLEHSQKMSTVKAICLTHLSHESIGGLPGVILTSADAAASAVADRGRSMASNFSEQSILSPRLDIIGPNGTKQFIHSLRHFMRREKFKVEVLEGSIDNFNYTTLNSHRKQDQVASSFFTISSIACEQEIEFKDGISTKKRRYKDSDQVAPTTIKQQIMSFIVKTPQMQGKFLIEKAIALGIPKGELFGQLKAGKTVSFVGKDGNKKTVESHEVVNRATPSIAVLILHYPTEVIAEEIFVTQSIQQTYLKNDILEVVIHIAPRDLFEKYGVTYCNNNKFFLSAKNIFLHTDRLGENCDVTPFQSSAIGAKARSLLNDEIYLTPSNSSLSSVDDICTERSYTIGRVMMEYNLIPRCKSGFQSRQVPVASAEEADLRCFTEISGALTLSKQVNETYEQITKTITEGELIFTGTGSALPCKHRNVTGMFLRQSDGRSMLLDVGEGTIGQLLRSQARCDEHAILSSVKAVWISHPHADHHLGLLRLLHDRKSPDPIILIAPAPIFRFLEDYSHIDPSITYAYDGVDCSYLVNSNKDFKLQIQSKLGIEDCRAVSVQHCPHSFACILEGTDFGRLVYSGDCRPSNALALAAKGADLLIHEATFEDGMEADAVLKRHSTVGEALDVASRMEAKCIILTHFSQRYPKIQPLSSGGNVSFPIIFAFDYMRLKPSTLMTASMLTPALRLLYPVVDECKDDSGCTKAEKTLSIPGIFADASLL